MNNRLRELGGGAATPATTDQVAVDVNDGSNQQDAKVQELMQPYEEMKRDLQNLSNTISNLRQLKNQYKSAMSSQEESAVVQQIDDLILQTNGLAAGVKGRLQQLKLENEKFKKDNPNSAYSKIRENMLQTYARKFSDVMEQYQKAQNDTQLDMKAKISRNISYVNPNATQQEIDYYIESGNASGAFQKQLGADVLSAVEDIRNKNTEIHKLEQSVRQLAELFNDLALLVETQDEKLDQIEYNVSIAKDYIEQGESELKKGLEYRKKARNKKCILIIILLVILVIILGSVLGGVLGSA